MIPARARIAPAPLRLSTYLVLTTLHLSLLSGAASALPLEPPPPPLPPATRLELRNGLRVVLIPNPSTPILEVQLGFRTGSNADPKGRSGTASLLGRMTTGGLRDLPEPELARELSRLGGSISADVSPESLTIAGQVPTFSEPALRRFLDLFFSCVLDNPLVPDVVAREKTLRGGLFSRVLENPDALADLAARLLTLGPSGRPTYGTPTSVSAITPADLAFFRDRVFVPQNGVLVIGGAFDPGALLAWLDTRLATWDGRDVTLEAGPIPGRYKRLCREARCLDNPSTSADTATRARRIILVTPDEPQLSQVPFRLTTSNPITLTHPQWPAFQLATFLLGGDFTSRLMQTLRVREGLTYGAYFSPDFLPHEPSAMMVTTDATPDMVPRAVTLALEEVARLAQEPIEDAELERSRKLLRESFAFKFETISHVVDLYLGLELSNLPYAWLASWKAQLAAPISSEVTASMAHLAPSSLALVVVGPAELAAPLRTLDFGDPVIVRARDLLDHGIPAEVH
jgi:zinc protease